MDHLAEAERYLDRSFELSPESSESHLAIMAAQAHALIAIGHTLGELVDTMAMAFGAAENGRLHVSVDHIPEIVEYKP